MTNENDTLDHKQLDELLVRIRGDAKETQALVDRLDTESEHLEGSADHLVDNVAENLATTREAAGLPAKDAEHFKANIERRRKVR